MSNEKDENFVNNENEHHHHDHECNDHDGCDCGHEHESITLEFDDGEVLDCPIIELFEIEGQEYIALLHPVEETALLYRFEDNEDGTIELTSIEDDEEYELVSETFISFMEEEEDDEE